MIHNWKLPVACGSLAPGSTVAGLARFLTTPNLTRPPPSVPVPVPRALLTLLSTDPRTQGPRPTLTSSEARQGGSVFLGVLSSQSGSPPPPSQASSPASVDGRVIRFPHQPGACRALGAPRLPLARAARGNLHCVMESHRATARGSGPCTPNLPSRCLQLWLQTPALQLTGRRGGRRRPRARRERSQASGVAPPRPGRQPGRPTTFQKQKGPRRCRSFKSTNKRNPQTFTSAFQVGEPKAFHRFPSSLPGGARREAGSRLPEAARAPAPSTGLLPAL